MVIDLMMFILIASVFFLIVSSQMSHQSSDAAVIRTQSMQIQRTMIALMNSRVESNSTFAPNATVAELIGERYCSSSQTAVFDKLNETAQNVMRLINKPNSYFILTFCPKDDCSQKDMGVCSPEIDSKFNCSIKIEGINVARMHMNLPCSYKYATIELGIWPSSMEVEAYVHE